MFAQVPYTHISIDDNIGHGQPYLSTEDNVLLLLDVMPAPEACEHQRGCAILVGCCGPWWRVQAPVASPGHGTGYDHLSLAFQAPLDHLQQNRTYNTRFDAKDRIEFENCTYQRHRPCDLHVQKHVALPDQGLCIKQAMHTAA